MANTSDCPYCGGHEVSVEMRRQSSRNSTTVGSWRVPYGMVAGVLVLLFGLLSFWAFQTLANPFFKEVAAILTGASFIFAAFVLGSAFYFSRWEEESYYRCKQCRAVWQGEDEASRELITAPTVPAQ